MIDGGEIKLQFVSGKSNELYTDPIMLKNKRIDDSGTVFIGKTAQISINVLNYDQIFGADCSGLDAVEAI
jgi:hypothetical protein